MSVCNLPLVLLYGEYPRSPEKSASNADANLAPLAPPGDRLIGHDDEHGVFSCTILTDPSCPICGTVFLPDASPVGLCPACLFRNALSDDQDPDELPDDSSTMVPPGAEVGPFLIPRPDVCPMTRQEITNLLRAARDGSPQALGELYERLGGRLLALIRLRMGRDLRARLESRDILQNTLLKSFQRLDQFDGGKRRLVDGVAGADCRKRDSRPGGLSAPSAARYGRRHLARRDRHRGPRDLAIGDQPGLCCTNRHNGSSRHSRRSSQRTERSSCCESSRS